MRLDERRPLPPVPALLAGTPLEVLAVLAAGVASCAALVAVDALPHSTFRLAAVVAGHGALLATALRWATVGSRAEPPALTEALAVVALLAVGATGATLTPWGALAYLAVPLWLAWCARRGRLARLGLSGGLGAGALMVGLAVGAVLGGHLLLSAGRTLGYHLRGDGAAAYLAALAYDVGANVPSSELFFRGALFNRAQRLVAFAPAVTLATLASLLRYVVDPLLPKTPEVVLGTLFYMTLLGVANAWLLWWSGSIVPGLLSALVFFAAYRLLAMA